MWRVFSTRWISISKADTGYWLAAVCIDLADDELAKAVNLATVADLSPVPKDAKFTQDLKGASLCVECSSSNPNTLRTAVDGFLEDVQLILKVLGHA